MEFEYLRTYLMLVPNTYLIMGTKEIGFWKKKQVYYAKFYFNGKHYFTIERDEIDDQETIDNFYDHYFYLFKIADRPFWNFTVKDFEEELWGFTKSDLFKDIWHNLGGGYEIFFKEEDGNFQLICGSDFKLISVDDKCMVYIGEPIKLTEHSYKINISRNCGELILAIIRLFVISLGFTKKRAQIPYTINSFLSASSEDDWTDKWAFGISGNIMDSLYRTGQYKDLCKSKLVYSKC